MLTLVILAAGSSQRFGRPKQLEKIGPGGETILDYSLFDAHRAGFEQVVFVIRSGLEAAFQRHVGAKWGRRLDMAYVIQTLDCVPLDGYESTRRTKPWGTAHAVLAAESEVRGAFGVANADDLYGPNAMRSLAAALDEGRERSPLELVSIAYHLRDTLSEFGPVCRAVLRTSPEGYATHVRELAGVERRGGVVVSADGDATTEVDGDALVSMNLWGLHEAVFPVLHDGFKSFLETHGDNESAEFQLPTAVSNLLHERCAQLRVVETRDQWCGLTRPQDKDGVAKVIACRVAQGVYPESLWS